MWSRDRGKVGGGYCVLTSIQFSKRFLSVLYMQEDFPACGRWRIQELWFPGWHAGPVCKRFILKNQTVKSLQALSLKWDSVNSNPHSTINICDLEQVISRLYSKSIDWHQSDNVTFKPPLKIGFSSGGSFEDKMTDFLKCGAWTSNHLQNLDAC